MTDLSHGQWSEIHSWRAGWMARYDYTTTHLHPPPAVALYVDVDMQEGHMLGLPLEGMRPTNWNVYAPLAFWADPHAARCTPEARRSIRTVHELKDWVLAALVLGGRR